MYVSDRQFPVAIIAIMVGLLFVVAGTIAMAGPVPLGFDDGNGTSQVDQYQGTAGDGWSTAWGANMSDPPGGLTGSISGNVISTDPLSVGGDYLSAAITNSRGMFNRRYDALDGSVDATQPHAIQFKYRLDSMSSGFSAGGRPVVIADNNGASSSTGSGNTWYVQVFGASGNWKGYSGGNTGVPLNVGTVYDITVMLRPADNEYDLYVSGGGLSGAVLNSSFRRTEGDVGRYLHFGDDTNGTTGGIGGESVEFSLDGLKILPAGKVWNNAGTGSSAGSWTYNDGNINWSGAVPPTAGDDAVIDNGGEAAIRSNGTAEVRTLYLGATPGGSGGLNWDRGDPIDLHVYQDLVVGEEGTGSVRMTNDFSGHTVTVDSNLYIGRRGGSTGTVTQDRGTLDVGMTMFVGDAGTGRFHIIGDEATIELDGYSQNALSTLELDINGISPINVDGTITLDGMLDVEFLAAPSVGDQFTIFLNDGDEAVSGTFAGLAEGSFMNVSGAAMFITYQANLDGGLIGNDVMLTAVPEPSALLLAGLALTGLLTGTRGRRRNRSA